MTIIVEGAKVSPWHPMTNPADIKHLGKLLEETGELSAIVARCLIQGILEREPDTSKSNMRALEEEIADVIANIELICERFVLNRSFINDRVTIKKARLKAWHDMA